MLNFGTLHGDKMSTIAQAGDAIEKTTSPTGEVWRYPGGYSANGYYNIVPLFNGQRYYKYEGRPNDMPVKATDQHQLVATISTSTPAKYINGAGKLTNKSTTGTITYKTFREDTISNEAAAQAAGWDNASQTYYQNSEARLNFYNVVTTTAQANFYLEGASTSTVWKPAIKNIRMYLEVADGFSITNYTGYRLVEKRPIPDSLNLLYVYEAIPYEAAHSYRLIPHASIISIYVHPNAPKDWQTPIVQGGVAFDGFVNEYMTPADGQNSYDTRSPYYRFTVKQQAFPGYWGIQRGVPDSSDPYGKVEYQMAFTTEKTQLKVEIAAIDKTVIKPGVEGEIHEKGIFKDHNKTNLQGYSWVKNATAGDLAQYETVYQLARAGKNTVGAEKDVEKTYLNDFSLYLTGPLQFFGTPDGLTITYYDALGGEVEINAASTEEQLRKVESIRVYFKNFEAGQV